MLKEEHSKPKDHFDGYKRLVKAGQPHLEGHFLELMKLKGGQCEKDGKFVKFEPKFFIFLDCDKKHRG